MVVVSEYNLVKASDVVVNNYDNRVEEFQLDVKVKVKSNDAKPGEYRLVKADDVTVHDYDDRPKCRGPTADIPARWVACRDCYRYRLIVASCGQRNCGRCQLKRSMMEYERYYPALQKIDCGGMGRKWIAVTLTGFRVPRDWIGQNAYMMMDNAKKLLQKWFLGGLVVVEHVLKKIENEYYLHAHALVIGDYVNNRIQREHGMTDIQMFESEWGYFVSLTSMHNDPQGHPRTKAQTVTAGLNYILKYVTKGVALEDSELDQVKRLRYIRTFGEVYKVQKPKVVSRCKFCYNGDLSRGRLAIVMEQDIEAVIRDGKDKPEPLETMRVLSWPQKAIKVPFDELKRQYDDLEDWFLRIGRNFRLRTALLRWIYVS